MKLCRIKKKLKMKISALNFSQSVSSVMRTKKQKRKKRLSVLKTDASDSVLSPDSVVALQCSLLQAGRPTLKRLKRMPMGRLLTGHERSENGNKDNSKKHKPAVVNGYANDDHKNEDTIMTNGFVGSEESKTSLEERENLDSDPDVDSNSWHPYLKYLAQNGSVTGDNVEYVAQDEDTEPIRASYVAAVNAGKGRCMVVMAPSQKLTFRGKCQLACLYGSVQVFGFSINPAQPPYDLFSPSSHCPLTIEALAHSSPGKTKKELRMRGKAVIKEHLSRADRQLLLKDFNSRYSILLLEDVETLATSFISGFPEFKHLFSVRLKERDKSGLELDKSPLASAGVLQVSADAGLIVSESGALAVEALIEACVEDDNGCPVIMVCGTKYIGKSTFTRYIINSLLNHIPCVEYLECDVGQTEFTPPGCLSLVKVTEPLLGPPFTHQKVPHRMMYYGEASCERDLQHYIEIIKSLWCSYKREVPLVINTMGWVKGFGLKILVDLIRLLSPTHVVQLGARDRQDMPQLTPEYVCTAPGWHTKGKPQGKGIYMKQNQAEDSEQERDEPEGDLSFYSESSGHQLLSVLSEFSNAGDANNASCHSNILRDMATLGYLSQLQPLGPGHLLPLHSLTPFQVPFHAVAVRAVHCHVSPTHLMYTLNASLVGLCRIPDDFGSEVDSAVFLSHNPVCECFGIGIVRGIDMKRKLYYISSPIDVEKLRLVNCFLVGSVCIPAMVFKNQVSEDYERVNS
ncbi:polynucleotide 5'-hydroxyl-kinase NOL9 [Protopterus annectens]|uniref:polynucleotide 5'-hydroxyl-kinase NOL9 n=1 Tax=Protopterus annectens TaxID=7888 RepID=UPI001CFB90D0|nr:polynucleotide 5'-hydroxyl-kinase NOL9 [Protopterus annectens]